MRTDYLELLEQARRHVPVGLSRADQLGLCSMVHPVFWGSAAQWRGYVPCGASEQVLETSRLHW